MKKLKLGVIGAGRIGKVHIATLVQSVPQAIVVAIADINLNSANEETVDLLEILIDYLEEEQIENVKETS